MPNLHGKKPNPRTKQRKSKDDLLVDLVLGLGKGALE